MGIFAEMLSAEPGVRHSALNMIPVQVSHQRHHHHDHDHEHCHVHPLS